MFAKMALHRILPPIISTFRDGHRIVGAAADHERKRSGVTAVRIGEASVPVGPSAAISPAGRKANPANSAFLSKFPDMSCRALALSQTPCRKSPSGHIPLLQGLPDRTMSFERIRKRLSARAET